MKLISSVKSIGRVVFPEYTGERVYMLPFLKKEGLPTNLLRWQPVVTAMLEGIETESTIYLMIDQGIVKKGNIHRRPRPHVDGNWDTGYGNQPPSTPPPYPPPNPRPGPRHLHRHGQYTPEDLILASNVSACQAFVGTFDGIPNEEGDCSHIDLSGGNVVQMQAGVIYRGNVTMIHESLPVINDCLRTVIRLNVPGVDLLAA